ncbi:MAG: hypothetical protein OQK98_13220 [Gammaproteobacteria bacterium]|nr:hypothetical protein [Gammaproteobacteria bacterium]
MNILNGPKRIILKIFSLILIIFSIVRIQYACAETIELTVLYPEASGGYAKVFKNILEGVNEFDNINVTSHRISNKTQAADVNNMLNSTHCQTIIALGQRSYKIAKQLNNNLPLTIGAIVATPNGHAGISMDGNPELFIEYLNNLAPDVKRVHVVYSEKNTGWLVEMAESAASKRNIELLSYKVENLKQGIQKYTEILNKVKSKKDAIWIPLDRVVPDKAILPKILKTAWDKNIVVFSNNPLHAKKGTLFALFPDHKLVGRKLASIAVEQVNAKGQHKLLPTSNLKLAVNIRTASHLGLSFSKSEQRKFDIVFPAR